MCVFLSVLGPRGAEAKANSHSAWQWRGGTEEEEHAGFNQSLQPIELQCVLVQWPTPD